MWLILILYSTANSLMLYVYSCSGHLSTGRLCHVAQQSAVLKPFSCKKKGLAFQYCCVCLCVKHTTNPFTIEYIHVRSRTAIILYCVLYSCRLLCYVMLPPCAMMAATVVNIKYQLICSS